MIDAVPMHMINRFHQLIHLIFDPILWKIVSLSLNCIIQIHIHELENHSQPACGFIEQHFNEADDIRVRGQSF